MAHPRDALVEPPRQRKDGADGDMSLRVAWVELQCALEDLNGASVLA
jgi:hypothetical protein